MGLTIWFWDYSRTESRIRLDIIWSITLCIQFFSSAHKCKLPIGTLILAKHTNTHLESMFDRYNSIFAIEESSPEDSGTPLLLALRPTQPRREAEFLIQGHDTSTTTLYYSIAIEHRLGLIIAAKKTTKISAIGAT